MGTIFATVTISVNPQTGLQNFKMLYPNGGYFITPQLTHGLIFGISTGTFKGKPSMTSPPTQHFITGYNAFGSSTTSIVIDVK